MPTLSTAARMVASDEELADCLKAAELAPLLVALAQATGDMRLLDPELMPPMKPANPFPGPQRGMTDEQLDVGRARALDALIQLRDNPERVQPLGADATHFLLKFISGNAPEDYFPLLMHELGLAESAPVVSPAKSGDFCVAIIGAGVAGLAAAREMFDNGVAFTLIEESPQVGGTWWNNRYPGCRLDTDNYTYSYSFAHQRDWPNQFSLREDIQPYLESVAEALDPATNFRLGTQVVKLVFNDGTLKWNLQLRNAEGQIEELTVNAVIAAAGQLDRPKIPEFPGQEQFQGASFHTAEWDHSVDLSGARVAVVGSGASAFQVVPAVVGIVGELTVFQRNAPWMSPTPHYYAPTSPKMLWLLEHVPNYDRWLRINRMWQMVDGRRPYAIVDPEWTEPGSVSALSQSMREALTKHISAQYDRKPELIERAIPSYPPYAKRMLRDNGAWADALQQPHTQVVSANIERLTSNAIVTDDGVEHKVDVIIYATGFLASEFLEPMVIKGRNGVDLHEQWNGDAKAYLGITVPNFPNLFLVKGPNTGLVTNGSYHLFSECAANYIAHAIASIRQHGADAMDLKWEPFEKFNEEVDAANKLMAWGAATVPSWYKNATGRVTAVWPFTTLDYWDRTRAVQLENYELLKAQKS